LACGNTLRGASDAHPAVSNTIEPIKPMRNARRTKPNPFGYREWQLKAVIAETF
jgi:hypothetical protein